MDVIGEVRVRVAADLTEFRRQLGQQALAEARRFDSAATQAFTNTTRAAAGSAAAIQNVTRQLNANAMAAAGVRSAVQASVSATQANIAAQQQVASLLNRNAMAATASARAVANIGQAFAGVQKAAPAAVSAMTAAMSQNVMAANRMVQGMSQAGTAVTSLSGGLGLGAAQFASLSHSARAMAESIALGLPPSQALLAQMNHLSFSLTGPNGLLAALPRVGTAVRQFLLTPFGLVVGVAAAGVAAIGGIFAVISSRLPSVSSAIDQHEKAIEDIREAWKRAASGSEEYRTRAQQALQFATNQDLRIQRQLLGSQLNGLLGVNGVGGGLVNQLSAFQSSVGSRTGFLQTNREAAQAQFLPAVSAFLEQARRGAPDVEKLNAEIERIANSNPADVALQREATRLREMTQAATDTTERIRALNEELTNLAVNQAFEAAGESQAQRALPSIASRLGADLQSMRARSPAELEAAARRREEQQLVSGESPAHRQARIDAEGLKARTQAEIQLKEALDQRVAAMNRSVAGAQLELGLIGKSTSEIERQRMQFSLLQAAQEAAARSHTKVSEQEIREIEAVSAAYGKLQESIRATQTIADLRFERAQMGRNAIDRAVQGTLHEQQLDPNSQLGRQVADEVRLNEQMKITVGLLDDIRQGSASALTKFVDDMRNGVSLGQSLKSLLSDLASQMIRIGSTLFIRGLLGEQGQAGGGLFGGIFSGLFNRAQSLNSATSAAAATSARPSTGPLLGAAGAAANDNQGVGQQIWNFFSAKGLPPHQVAAIVGAAKTESQFNPSARGGAGEYGLFQNLGARQTGLFAYAGSTAPTTQQQLEYAWREMQGSESRAYGNLTASRNVLDASRAMAGFERPRGFSWSNPEASMNFTGRLQASQEALLKYGDSMQETAGNFNGQFRETLGGLATNTNQAAQKFAPSFQNALQTTVSGVAGQGSAGGSTGLLGWLGGLFGGGLSSGASALATSGAAGLFAEGGVSDGPAIFGERGPEAAIPLSRNRRIPVEFKASPKMRQEMARRTEQGRPNQHITIEGSTIVVQGSVDQKTLAEMERRLDERDGKIKNDLAKGQIGGVTQKYGSLKG